MIINSAIASIVESVSDYTDDFSLSKRFIYNELINTRSELIKQELNKKRLFDSSYAQSLSNFKFTLPETDTFARHNKLLVSDEIPSKLIEWDQGLSIWVYDQLGDLIIFTDKITWKNKINRRYQPNIPLIFMENNRLYLYGYGDLDEIDLDTTGYFYDPYLVEKYNDSDNDGCTICKAAYEYDLALPEHIGRRTIEIVRNVVLRKLNIPQDDENNSILDKQPTAQQNVSSKNQP